MSNFHFIWQESNKQYIDAVNKIQAIANSLVSSNTVVEVIVKDEANSVKISAEMVDADEPN